jgi:hypothetical protein
MSLIMPSELALKIAPTMFIRMGLYFLIVVITFYIVKFREKRKNEKIKARD